MELQELWLKKTQQIANDVNEACLKFGGSITSGMRSVDRNRIKGGSITSWHLDGLAFDVHLDRLVNKAEFMEFLRTKGYRGMPVSNGAFGAFHVQYDWPIIKDFIRDDHLSHLKALLDNGYEVK